MASTIPQLPISKALKCNKSASSYSTMLFECFSTTSVKQDTRGEKVVPDHNTVVRVTTQRRRFLSIRLVSYLSSASVQLLILQS